MNGSISIVVVSYNTKKHLSSCLISLLKNIDKKRDHIIVVDNASSDGTIDMLRNKFPNIETLANNENRGFSYACNIGLNRSMGDFVLFVNSDVELLHGTLDKMRTKMMSEKNIGILSPELVSHDGRLAQMSWGWNLSLFGEMKQKFFSPTNVRKFDIIRNLVGRLQSREKDVPLVAGACMLTRRSLMTRLKGLDENFELYFEDADLCLRCWKEGYSVRFAPQIKVYHGLGQSGKSNPRKILLVYRQSQIYFYKKHNPAWELFFLKMYLWSKFITSFIFWKDPTFRFWIGQILGEKKHLKLSA